MGHRHTKEQILEGALAAALADGLSQLTFGRLARRLGISDRVVVYYFPTKNDLISEVILSMGLQLQQTLTEAFATKAANHIDVVRAAWPIVASSAADPVFALFFEANGLAASGRQPYAGLVPELVEAWIDWVSGFIDAPEGRRRSEAEAAIAVVDGLLLLRQLAGPQAADRAARAVGVLTGDPHERRRGERGR